MASQHALRLLTLLLLLVDVCSGSSRKLSSLYNPPPTILSYHRGPLLEGIIPVSIVWYGIFSPAQKSVVSDFLLSLTPLNTTAIATPSVSDWWKTVNVEYVLKSGKKKTRIVLADQVSDADYSIGKSLLRSQLSELAKKPGGPRRGGVAVVLTSEDVAVEGFCMSDCGLHGSDSRTESAFIWVGNSASQCPGWCAWPFHQPVYGPQGPPLVAPSGDVGVDGMVVNLATLLAGTVTNPFGSGFFQGPPEAPVEVAAVCPGMYGTGAYPGYAGDLLVDRATGASYNAHGEEGRKYLLPALFDPSTSSCSTLV